MSWFVSRFLQRLGRNSFRGRTSNLRRCSAESRASRLGFEKLEDRNLLAGVYLSPTGGVLTIFGGSGNDAATAFFVNSSTVRVSFTGVSTFDYADYNVKSLVFIGFAGDDTFTNNTAYPSQMIGHAGNDTLNGGSDNDRLNGGPGDDAIEGRDGADVLVGVSGNDIFRGGNGNDRIFGSLTGTNRIYGDDGYDQLFGGNNVDEIYGGVGLDQIFGLAGDDLIFTGAGGTAGTPGTSNADLAMGLAGNDTITGESGLDVLYGGDGDDIFVGGNGENRIHGQNGNDTLTGGYRNDFMFGGDGNDLLFGLAGNDFMRGGNGDDSLYGGEGIDELFGEFGDDGLFAGYGYNETPHGGDGADRFLISDGDVAADQGRFDADIHFVYSTSYWNDKEIESIDRGLRELHLRTNSTVVLKDSIDPNPITFQKVAAGSIGAYVRGDNQLQWSASFDSTGKIISETYLRKYRIPDWDESIESENEWAGLTAIHEIAHAWDSDFEIGRQFPGQASLWDSFLATSYWVNYDPGSAYTNSGYQTREPFDRTWVPAANTFEIHNRTWWYSTVSAFPRPYSKTTPKEDWSTAWESIFVDKIVASPTTAYSQQVSAKVNIVQALLNVM